MQFKAVPVLSTAFVFVLGPRLRAQVIVILLLFRRASRQVETL